MIENDVVDAFNKRMTVDLNNIRKMSPAQQDRVKDLGSQAENLLKNRDFAYFVHTYKFECIDQLAEIATYTQADDAKRVAISNQIAGIDGFVKSLKRAVYYKNRVVTNQTKQSEEPIA